MTTLSLLVFKFLPRVMFLFTQPTPTLWLLVETGNSLGSLQEMRVWFILITLSDFEMLVLS